MSGATCPVCGAKFDAAGALREHAWESHGACHYCGDQFDGERSLYAHWLLAHDDLNRADRKRAEAEVGSLSVGERLEHGGVGAAAAGVSRRTLLLAGGAVVAGGGALLAGEFLGGGSDPGGSNPPDGTVASAPVPAAPDEHRYATMGSGDADLTVTYYGNWKCPHCGRFSNGFLSTLVSEYVEPGRVAIEFRHLAYTGGQPFLGPDSPAAGHAGLAVWNVDPSSYWAYHEHVFRNQPSESQQWATADRLARFAEEAGVSDPGAVRAAVEESRYGDALRSTSNAATGAGVRGTPSLVVDGTVVSPFERERTRRQIENALG